MVAEKDRLAIARRSLKDRIVNIVSLTRVLVSCLVGVWFGCISVPTTVRESATTPDSKENEQADASTRIFSTVFSAARCCEDVRQQSVKVHLHMYNGNVQHHPFCAACCVANDIPISPRFSPTRTIFYRDANSINTLTSTPLYSSMQ